MKVVTSQEMAHIESLAYRDGSSESDFMEEAGSGIALAVQEFIDAHNIEKHVILLCGKGNNGGDAYVAGVHLLQLGYDVFAFQLTPVQNCSSLCQQNHYRFLAEGGYVREVDSIEDVAFPMHGLIIDGIFGTGFRGEVKDLFAAVIAAANLSGLPIIAVDIPSGLNGDTGEANGEVIIATETAFLGLPKTGFFLNDGWNHVGVLRYVDYGLPQQYIEQTTADFLMITQEMVNAYIPPIKRNRHKYERGYVVGLAGSPGMPGAAILSSWAALCGGAGIVRLLHPDGMQNELAASPYELIKVPYKAGNIEDILTPLEKATALFIGPGIGREQETRQLLHSLLPRLTKPCVIDADALTLISEENIALPEQAILTPQKAELERLLKLPSHTPLNMDLLKKCQEYAEDKKVTLILKGGPTFIFQPGEPIVVNPRGDPGMATAGSGDVLTGLLAALLSNGLTPHHAAMLGVYLHAVSGEYAAEEKSSYCMTASDIILHFPEAFSS
jgi:hydroxyethylthiazole kinase-like uncharacterized protein yjeF